MIDAERTLVAHQLLEPGAAIGTSADEQAQRPAMNREAFDVVEIQPVSGKERRQAVKRMIEEMFMIDRVEFAFLDHVDGICEFKDRHAGRLQELRETGDEIVDRVDMRHDVVAIMTSANFPSLARRSARSREK